MDRRYTGRLLLALSEKQRMVQERGLDITVKPIPDSNVPGAMDPRLYAEVGKRFIGLRGFFAHRAIRRMRRTHRTMTAEQLRGIMNGVKSLPVTRGIVEERIVARGEGFAVPIRLYLAEAPDKCLRPVLYYIHGGGFVGGGPDVVAELCRLIVETTDCVCVSVDYRLAPEHPYPAGLDDCYAVLKWIAANAGTFGGDGRSICIAGDSAGGNLAAVCALRDRDDGGGLVKAQALLYPAVNLARVENENYHFNMQLYSIAPKYESIVGGMIEMMREGVGSAVGAMLGAKDLASPYVSPYLADLRGLPPCILLYGEHDFLRLECEAYARKLKKLGVHVRAVRYSGMGHGFADAIGVYPQAEDCAKEIGRFMMERA